MKKIFKKSNIFAFILGAIIFGSIGVVSAYTIFANDIGYTPKDTTWKKSNGEDITNVQDAIDELYSKSSSISTADCVSGTYHHDANTQWNISLNFNPSFFITTTYISESNLYLVYYYNSSLDGHIHQNYKYQKDGNMTIGSNFYDSRFKLSSNGIAYSGESNWDEIKYSHDLYYIACK